MFLPRINFDDNDGCGCLVLMAMVCLAAVAMFWILNAAGYRF